MKRPIDWREDRSAVREKVAESAHCVLPIVLIVVLLCLTAAPMKPDLLLSFLIGGVMLVVGMGLFSLGAAPQIVDNRTYVPLQIFEILMGNVEGMFKLDGTTVTIDTKAGK